MGKLREGYKQTKVGVIPEEWEVVTFNDLRDTDVSHSITGGPFGSNLKSEHYTKTGVRIIQLQNIGDGSFINKDFIYTNEEKATELKSCLIYPNDIILAKMAEPVARACIIPSFENKFLMGSDGIRLHIDKKKYDNKFILESINYKQFRQIAIARSTGSTRQRIGLSDLKKIPIIIPPIKEQQKIAQILTTWDDAISKQEALIGAKEQRKKGLMQKLLSGEVRFAGFDGEWEEVRLGDILRERKTYLEKGLALEHVSLTVEGVVPKSERYERDFLVKDDNKKYKITKKHDICYNPANLKFGVICRNTYGDGIFSPIYVTFEVKNTFDIGFASYLLTWDTFIQKVRKYEQGTVYERMAVSPKDFLLFKIKLPSKQEQQKIAQVLTTADKEIALHKEELEALKEQKRGLMQRLLTGEVRVKG